MNSNLIAEHERWQAEVKRRSEMASRLDDRPCVNVLQAAVFGAALGLIVWIVLIDLLWRIVSR